MRLQATYTSSVILLISIWEFLGVRTSPTVENHVVLPQSPLAVSAEDPLLGQNAIFRPVSSCLSEVILVIYLQSLDMMEKLDLYKDMYGPFVAGTEFYVDGTWCDPSDVPKPDGRPCYGPPLNRSSVPADVRVIENNGGGWLMQRSLIDATQRSRGSADPRGFLFITDDVLLNLGQLTRAANASGCDVIWRSAEEMCEDIESDKKHHRVFDRFLLEAREFFQLSSEKFKEQLARNMESPSLYCMGKQNDFLYVPSTMATAWADVAQQMTDLGLVFTFAFNTAIYGIAAMEDMLVLQTHYLEKEDRADKLLEGAEFDEGDQSYCWRGKGDVRELLGMHIIHPNKIAFSKKSWDFARTVNSPLAKANIFQPDIDAFDGGAVEPMAQIADATAFWCK